jgi:hypothetical protein
MALPGGCKELQAAARMRSMACASLGVQAWWHRRHPILRSSLLPLPLAIAGPGPELRPCSCKNSRCLKLYCICFDAGRLFAVNCPHGAAWVGFRHLLFVSSTLQAQPELTHSMHPCLCLPGPLPFYRCILRCWPLPLQELCQLAIKHRRSHAGGLFLPVCYRQATIRIVVGGFTVTMIHMHETQTGRRGLQTSSIHGFTKHLNV